MEKFNSILNEGMSKFVSPDGEENPNNMSTMIAKMRQQLQSDK